MQQRHIHEGRVLLPSRSRLPKGFIRFRKDLGRILRRRRRYEGMLQVDLAEAAGITRESLSRIERGRAWPSPDTLYQLTRLLSLDWPQVAIAGRSCRVPKMFPSTWRDEARVELGAALRAGRKQEGLSLRDLAEACGISYSQLSRIERGESIRSRVLEEHPDDGADDYEHRRMRFTHPLLIRLEERGRPLI